MLHLSRLIMGAGLLAVPAFGQLVGPFDFESAGQLSANFRSSLSASTSFASQQTSGGNGFLSVNASGVSNPFIGIYDITPADSLDAAQTFSGTFTISFDISAPVAGASFGIFLFDPANAGGNNLLTILNLDAGVGGAGFDQIRFWRDTSITTSAVTNQYTTSSFTGTNGGYDSGSNSWITNAGSAGAATTSTTSPFTFYHLDFSYDPTLRTLQLSSPGFSATLNIPSGDVISNPGFALRINDNNVSDGLAAKVDNLVVVPEPTSFCLLALGGLISLRRRR